jgi:fatty acid desaturase
MDASQEPADHLSRPAMKALLARRNGPGIVLFTFQLLAFATLSVASVRLAAAGSPWLAPVVVANGLVLLMFFASMHEAGHGTAFASPRFNTVVLWISALLMLQAPTFFREFHFEHHRRTGDPKGDPEISGAPGILGPWPPNPLLYLAQASGQHLMLGKLMFTLSCALLPFNAFLGRTYPFLKRDLQRRVVLESIVVSVLLGASATAGLVWVPGFGAFLAAWPVAHLGLGLFVMPEHTGLPSSGTQFDRTRSTRSNALVRWAMWNMPWHVEHHAYAAVPFHALPALGRHLDARVLHRSRGYLAFHVEALARSLRLR